MAVKIWLVRCLISTITSLFFFSPLAAETTYYVAPDGSDANPGTLLQPFQTIEKARSAVRSVNNDMSSDITVYLRGGTYRLSTTLLFDSGDSGTNDHNVIYRSFPGESAHISGGRVISGWTPVGNGIYSADAGSLRFRQLYVNGVPGIRARSPNTGSMYRMKGWNSGKAQAVIDRNEIGSWSRLNDVELIFHTVFKQDNLHINGYEVSGDDAYVSLAVKFLDADPQPGESYYFENAYELLDSPGEWYLNPETGQVFYKPRDGEDLSTALVTVPVVERLIELKGTLDAPIGNIQFYRIVFEESNWTAPDANGYQNGLIDVPITEGYIPGAVHIEAATDLRFERNVFRNMGGDAVVLYRADHGDIFVGNVFKDISGSAIAIDPDQPGEGVVDYKANPPDSRNICRDIVIRNNYFARMARDYHGSVAIFATYASGLVIEHNEVTDVPYTGISVGWGSTTEDTSLKNNSIRYNRIHGVMKLLSDGGGIYTQSKQPGTEIVENYVYDTHKSQWSGPFFAVGIYLDNNSGYMTLKNNVVETSDLPYFLHVTSHVSVVNVDPKDVSDYTPSANAYSTDGIFDRSAVKANSGIEPAYQDILIADTGLPAQTASAYSIGELGTTVRTTIPSTPSPQVGYARVQPGFGSNTPAAMVILSYRVNDILVSETTVPASPLLTSGRGYFEVSPDGSVNTGVAIANPADQTATVNFSFTDLDGQDFGGGTMIIPPHQQVAKFLSAFASDSCGSAQGTFSFDADVPIALIALREFVNERGESLMTSLPIVDARAPQAATTQVLAYFVDGSGWTTQIILVNPTDAGLSGTVEFVDGAGVPIAIPVRGSLTASVPYSIERRSSWKLVTSGLGALISGSVRVVATGGGTAPGASVIFSYKPSTLTVSQSGLPSTRGTALRLYVESALSSGEIGNIQTGIAIANTSAILPTNVTLQLFAADGWASDPVRVTIPANGETAKFLDELFAGLRDEFHGVMKILTDSSEIAVMGLRGTVNERGDFLITAMPAIVEDEAAGFGETVLPQVLSGGGFSSQVILFSGRVGQSASGNLQFFRQNGTPFDLTLN